MWPEIGPLALVKFLDNDKVFYIDMKETTTSTKKFPE